MINHYKFGDIIRLKSDSNTDLIVVAENCVEGDERVTVRNQDGTLSEYSMYDMQQPFPFRSVITEEFSATLPDRA